MNTHDKIDLPPLPCKCAGEHYSSTIVVTLEEAEDAIYAAIEAALKRRSEPVTQDIRDAHANWVQGPYVTDTMASGWCVRIDGTSVFDGINQYGTKGRTTFEIAGGLQSKEEAQEVLRKWCLDALSQPAEPGRGEPVAFAKDGNLIVIAGVILTHPVGVNLTHLGNDGGFLATDNVDSGASSGDQGNGASWRQHSGNGQAARLLAQHNQAIPA